MKMHFDKKAVAREHKVGDLVLMFLPVRKFPLQAKYQGSFQVIDKLNDTNYVISTPGKRKERKKVHVNLLRKYLGESVPVASLSGMSGVDTEDMPEMTHQDKDFALKRASSKLTNRQWIQGPKKSWPISVTRTGTI